MNAVTAVSTQMPRRSFNRMLAVGGVSAAWLALPRAARAEFRPPEEKAIWTVWKQHVSAPDDHAGVATACAAFIEQNPLDPYVVVARALRAWCLLKLENTDEAVKILTLMTLSPYTSEERSEWIRRTHSEKLHEIGIELARRWLTRIDREALREALRQYYLKEVSYPRRLDELATPEKGPALRMRDRWDRSWSYRVSGYESIKDTYGQQYHLSSVTLGEDSSLAEALDVPYASRIVLEPVRVFSTGGKREMLEFKSATKEGSIFLRVGTTIDGTTFAFQGDRLIVLCDGDHFKIIPKPRE